MNEGNDGQLVAGEKRERPAFGPEKVHKLLAAKLKPGTKAAIFTHPCPDPDAIGSMMAMAWMIQECFEAEADCFFDGHVSHPQNMATCNLLDPDLKHVSDYKPDDYVVRILVDTVPAYAAVGEAEVDFDLVVDHHKEAPNGGFRGLFYNIKSGSCCGTVYHLIKAQQLKFQDGNDRHSKVATAVMVGIITDTDNMMSDDTTAFEFEAYQELFPFRDPDSLKKIVNYKRPKSWIDARAAAAGNAVVDDDGIGVVGIGFLAAKQRDLIADVADEMASWANVETCIAFAVVDGDRIEGSVRSTNASVSVPHLCKDLGSRHGSGGGKLGKGAYRYTLGGVECEEEDEDETRRLMWEFIKDKETKRIFRIVKK